MLRDFSANTYAALTRARRDGLVPRHLVWIEGRNRTTGDPVGRGFSSLAYNISLNVEDRRTGVSSPRDFIGGGALLGVGEIEQSLDLAVQSVTVRLSQLHDAVNDLVRFHSIRLGHVHIYEVLLDVDTHQIVDPEIEFVGIVKAADVATPAAGAKGGIAVTVEDEIMRALTLTNPRKKSHAAQQRRGGDQARKYSNVGARFDRVWGEHSATRTDRPSPPPPEPPQKRV